MPSDPKFSLILPVYNAGPIAVQSFHKIIAWAQNARTSWEILFVCDGCSDGSDAQLAQLASAYQQSGGTVATRVIRYQRNRGKGHAVKTGLLAARGAYRIFTDIDLAYRLDMVEAIAEQLHSGQQVAIATRAHIESEIVLDPQFHRRQRWRNLQSLAFRTCARLILGLKHRDSQAGLKGLSADAARLLLPYVRCSGFGFDCDLLVACRYFGINVREVPIRVVYDQAHSTTHALTGLRMLGELLSIRRRWKKSWHRGPGHSVLVKQHAQQHAARRFQKKII